MRVQPPLPGTEGEPRAAPMGVHVGRGDRLRCVAATPCLSHGRREMAGVVVLRSRMLRRGLCKTHLSVSAASLNPCFSLRVIRKGSSGKPSLSFRSLCPNGITPRSPQPSDGHLGTNCSALRLPVDKHLFLTHTHSDFCPPHPPAPV